MKAYTWCCNKPAGTLLRRNNFHHCIYLVTYCMPYYMGEVSSVKD